MVSLNLIYFVGLISINYWTQKKEHETNFER